jgi:CHAT domain-containing protein
MQSLDLSFLRPSYQLYQALIQPAQHKKPLTANISIIPDDVLNLVNFESLVTELPGEERIYLPSFGDYLVNRHQLSYAFSATTLYETKPSKKENQNNYLGIAPEMSEGFQLEDYWFDKLEYNEEEVLHAGSLFPRQNIVESNNVKDQFIKLAPSYGLIHFATHAMANNRDGDLSFILLGEEPTDIMYAKDLYGLDLNANLVVLSACQTSAGELNRGEGIISLARSFTYAGATSIVTSLWNVREKTNKEIIYDFYKLLKKGKSKDEALRTAKLNYIGNLSQENYMNAHPYFWAPLIIIGDPEPLQINYSWREITAISLLLILLIVLMYRFRKSNMKK